MVSKIIINNLERTQAGNDPWDNRLEGGYIWPDVSRSHDYRIGDLIESSQKTRDGQDQESIRSSEKPDQYDLAFIIQELLGESFMHSPYEGWCEWDGRSWRTSRGEQFQRRVIEILSSSVFNRDQFRITSPLVKGVCSISEVLPSYSFEGVVFDKNLQLLNTPDGMVDLRVGKMLPHSRTEFCTKLTTTSPSDSEAPYLRRFLTEITCGDQSLENYLQQMIGSTLSGAKNQHWMAFFEGSGANGKNVLMDTIGKLLGGYTVQIRSESLMLHDTKSSGATPELAKLKGTRLAIGSEISKSAFLDDERVKSITGDGRIVARQLYQPETQFDRTFKMIVLCNNTPRTREVSPGMRRRIIVVPFNFVAENEDPNLSDKLLSEGPQVLQWLINGHIKWIKGAMGLPRCKAVLKKTDEYFDEQPTPLQWLKEYCSYHPDSDRPASDFVSVNAAYQNYREIYGRQGYSPVSMHVFSQSLPNIERVKSNSTRLLGVTLKYPNPLDTIR
ncbi:MAG: phage/plasmid primase, P4 family [Pseudomonadota bacterium]|nr:phage/plasmid primase, P4 family [Pseudomonadota bacterium]